MTSSTPGTSTNRLNTVNTVSCPCPCGLHCTEETDNISVHEV